MSAVRFVVLSVDAMGGKNAPYSVVKAMSSAAAKHGALRFLVFGNEAALAPLLVEESVLSGRYEVVHAASVVEDEHSPMYAFKKGRDSSMRKAIDAVRDGVADACVSCGNTGALLVTAKLVLGTITGIKRPAIAGVFPTAVGKSVMLDMGANSECSDAVLFQFAMMGRCLAKVLLGLPDPSIGILNIGEEESKGRDLEQKTAKLLVSSGLNFAGYIEGHAIAQGKADVVVTDGFSGNLVLKSSEGAVEFCLHLLKQATQRGGVLAKIGGMLLKNSLRKTLGVIDPNSNNGAMIIGLNGIVVKSHGSASITGIANAMSVAYDLAQREINQKIAGEMRVLADQGIGLDFIERIKRASSKILDLSQA